jgi:hypothetical protein
LSERIASAGHDYVVAHNEASAITRQYEHLYRSVLTDSVDESHR